MKSKISALLLFSFAFSLAGNFVYAQDGQTGEFSGEGTNVLRVEQEDKLWVPLDRADEVWAFMENKFVSDQSYIKSVDPEFASYWYLEEFWDTYYDTPTFQVLGQHNGVRHRRRINHTNPEHNKSGRELMQIKINNVDNNPLNRGEFKFDIEPPQNSASRDDRHPMLHLVKPDHRQDFKGRLEALGIDPYSMKEVLTVHDMRSRIYITKKGQPFMSISFDRADARIWWATYNFVEIEPELNEITYTEGDAATREYMEKVLGQVVGEIRKEFPFIEQNLTPKYSKSYNALNEQLPFFPLLVKFNVHNWQGMMLVAIIFAALVGLAIYIPLRWYGVIQREQRVV